MSLSLAEPASGVKAKRRRRLWSADEKRRMIDECRAPGASVAAVALCHGVNANLLFAVDVAAGARRLSEKIDRLMTILRRHKSGEV